MALKNAYMKQSKCPLMDETDKENVACRYNGISFSLYKKETPFVFALCFDVFFFILILVLGCQIDIYIYYF